MKIKYFIILCCFLATVSVEAQVKSLQECVRIALENNIRVKQSQLNLVSSDLDYNQSKAARYPSLSAGSSLNVNGRSVDPTSNTFNTNAFYTNNFNLSSNILLYNGGAIQNNIKQSKLSIESASLQKQDIEQQIALQVANAYLSVLFAQENVAIETRRKEITETQLSQLEKLISGGLRPRNDIFELTASLAGNEQSLIQAKGNLELAKLQLNQSMQISANEQFELEIPEIILASLEDPFSLDPDKLYISSAERQPAIKNSGLQINIAKLNKTIAKSGLLPTLGFGGSLGTNYSSLAKSFVGSEPVLINQDVVFNGQTTSIGFIQQSPIFEDQNYFNQIGENITYGFGLSLQVPIYSNLRNKTNIRKSEIAIENSILNDENNRTIFRQQIEQAIIDARNAKKSHEAALKSVEASLKSLENLQSSFSAGNVNSFQLNIATTQYNSAQLQSIITKYDYIFKMKVIDFYQGKPLNF